VTDDPIDRLISAGRLAEAAEALEGSGRPARATELYEQLWDFAAATRTARAAGDYARAVRNALQLRDPAAVDALLAEVEGLGPELALACAATCTERAAWPHAARLYIAGGDRRAAAECHERAGALAEAARLYEGFGELKHAMELYRRHLSELSEEGDLSLQLAAHAPTLALGRLLLRFGRTEEALPLLQRAWRHSGDPETATVAGRAVVAALARMGCASGARYAVNLLNSEERPEQPTQLRDCVDDPDISPVAAGAEKILANRYRLGSLLGSGGMGRVYLAHDQLTERRVAVKVFTAPIGARGRDAFRRFVKEARTTGQLNHPHIVSLLDFHEEMGFMVLEYMAGGTLAERLRPRVEVATCRAVFLQVLAGLAAAHQRGIVHRDIKPSNIFFTQAGAAKLGDFGVAHLQDAGQTQTGAFIGTLAFMSPEQIRGDPVSFATDIYALGVTLFQMVTGQLPFTHPDLVAKHLGAAPPRPSSILAGLPAVCDETILGCLAKRPEQRFDSLESLRRAVERFPVVEDRPGGARPTVEAGPASRGADDRQRRGTDRRFTVESTLVEHGALQVLEAQDGELGRAVLLVRTAPGPDREPLWKLLATAAAVGGEGVQRVLSLDHERGQAVLEAPLGEAPALPPPDRVAGLRVAEQLGLALAPLHAAGLAHGAIQPTQITCLGDSVILGLTGALTARAKGTVASSPADDVAAVLDLLHLPRLTDVAQGEQLAAWAREQLAELQRGAEQQLRRDLVGQVMDGAPPEIRAPRPASS
jgi:tetratricopeptide (TPR) repeat protein